MVERAFTQEKPSCRNGRTGLRELVQTRVHGWQPWVLRMKKLDGLHCAGHLRCDEREPFARGVRHRAPVRPMRNDSVDSDAIQSGDICEARDADGSEMRANARERLRRRCAAVRAVD